MGLIDGVINRALTDLSKLLGAVEKETEEVLPVKDLEEIQTHVLGNVSAIKDATEQLETHAAALEKLVDSMPSLVTAVEEMTRQLGVIAAVLAPVAEAEQDVSKLSQLLHRHRHHEPSAPAVPSEPPPTLHG